MKKLFSILFIATMVSIGMALASCDDDKEPEIPTGQTIESVTESENDARLVFEFNNDKDSCSIYLYNIKFSEEMPVTINVRIDAPYTYVLKTYTILGNNISPYMQRGGTWAPMTGEEYRVTNLVSLVNLDAKVYSISFDCHGGHYEKTGKLK